MNKTWSFYHPDSGVFEPCTVSAPEGADLSSFAPGGHVQLEGEYDHLSQRYDVGDTEAVIDYQPPAPEDDELRTWSWDANIKRWVATLTVAGRKPPMLGTVEAQMLAIETTEQARPTRELVLALLAATTPPTEAVEALEAVEAELTALRAKRAAVEAATTHTDLDEIDL